MSESRDDLPWIPDESDIAAFRWNLEEAIADGVASFTQYHMAEAFDMGYVEGVKDGYRKAVEESYPELDTASGS